MQSWSSAPPLSALSLQPPTLNAPPPRQLTAGAQYEDGTTDVTRTMHFGEPTSEQKQVRRRWYESCVRFLYHTLPRYPYGLSKPAHCMRYIHTRVIITSVHVTQAYSRVLQGHIGLATATFPDGTPGFMIDAFARRFLWDVGLDYQHGTGHGVGAALNVHEGPHVRP